MKSYMNHNEVLLKFARKAQIAVSNDDVKDYLVHLADAKGVSASSLNVANGMTECEIDSKIKNYWACKEKLIPEDILHRMEELCKEFQDATEDNPVNAAEFLMYLELSFLEGFLKGLYKREPIYPAESMLKALFLMDLKGMKFYTELKRHLRNNRSEAEMLGFPRKEGHALMLSDKSFWHFDHMRIGQKWDVLFSLIRDSTAKEAGVYPRHPPSWMVTIWVKLNKTYMKNGGR